MRVIRLCFALIACIPSLGLAQTAPKIEESKAVTTKIYDIKTLLGARGKTAGIADGDAILKLILEAIPQPQSKPGDGGPQIVEREGGKLEVRASASVHSIIRDLLEALTRLADLAVDVQVDVIELDPATYDKWRKAIPSSTKEKPGSPILFATRLDLPGNQNAVDKPGKPQPDAVTLLQGGRLLQTSTVRVLNGAEATVSARQSLIPYQTQPQGSGLVSFVKEGFKLVGSPVVSGDRRFVRLKLSEESTAVVGIRKRVIGDQIVASSPETEDLGTTVSTTLPDGGTVAIRLAYAPKDKVLVALLRTTIFIQAEAELLKKRRE